MPDTAKLPCHANPWQLDHGHGTNQTSSPLSPAPHCQIRRQGLRLATGMRGAASIIRPRGFRGCFVGVWLAKSQHLPSSSGHQIRNKQRHSCPLHQIRGRCGCLCCRRASRRVRLQRHSNMLARRPSKVGHPSLSCVITARVVGASSSSQSQRMETS